MLHEAQANISAQKSQVFERETMGIKQKLIGKSKRARLVSDAAF